MRPQRAGSGGSCLARAEAPGGPWAPGVFPECPAPGGSGGARLGLDR
jgi:hypothetical protein